MYNTILGSDLEMRAIRKAYMDGGGRLQYVLKHVPFANSNDQPRINGLVDGMCSAFFFLYVYVFIGFVVLVYFVRIDFVQMRIATI